MRERLKAARKEKGMTHEQIADYLGVGARHYKKIESGETLGSIEIWDKLEDLFSIHQRILRKIRDPKDNQ